LSAPVPGWYPDPADSAAQRYWNGTGWTHHRAAAQRPVSNNAVSLEKIVIIPFAVVFGGLALVFALAGEWKALGGVALLAVLVGAPLALALLLARRARQARQNRAQRRDYEAGLLARFNQASRADDQFAAPLAYPDPNDLPDAEQMRRQAWQPDLQGQAPAAVRPKNPAPWHVVTQFPTRQFEKPVDAEREKP
jgi:hypothetical protein